MFNFNTFHGNGIFRVFGGRRDTFQSRNIANYMVQSAPRCLGMVSIDSLGQNTWVYQNSDFWGV